MPVTGPVSTALKHTRSELISGIILAVVSIPVIAVSLLGLVKPSLVPLSAELAAGFAGVGLTLIGVGLTLIFESIYKAGDREQLRNLQEALNRANAELDKVRKRSDQRDRQTEVNAYHLGYGLARCLVGEDRGQGLYDTDYSLAMSLAEGLGVRVSTLELFEKNDKRLEAAKRSLGETMSLEEEIKFGGTQPFMGLEAALETSRGEAAVKAFRVGRLLGLEEWIAEPGHKVPGGRPPSKIDTEFAAELNMYGFSKETISLVKGVFSIRQEIPPEDMIRFDLLLLRALPEMRFPGERVGDFISAGVLRKWASDGDPRSKRFWEILHRTVDL